MIIVFLGNYAASNQNGEDGKDLQPWQPASQVLQQAEGTETGILARENGRRENALHSGNQEYYDCQRGDKDFAPEKDDGDSGKGGGAGFG